MLDLLPTAGERAIEVLPTHGMPRRLDRLVELGFDAVSVGVQSFDDDVLTHLGRPHRAEHAAAAVAAARDRFALVDVDLILDAAYDDARSGVFLRDLARCFEAGVEQVSTYPLMRFGYTPFGRVRHERRREHELLDAAAALAERSGYERRSVWTFNRLGAPTYSSITRPRFVGFGAGASSFLGRDFVVNHFGLRQYCEAVEAGRPPVARRLHLGALGGAYEAFWQAYSGALPAVGGRSEVIRDAALAPLRACGWLRREPDGVQRLTASGYRRYHDLERLVTYRLIEPLWAEVLAEHAASDAERVWAKPPRSPLLWRAISGALDRPV